MAESPAGVVLSGISAMASESAVGRPIAMYEGERVEPSVGIVLLGRSITASESAVGSVSDEY